MDWTPLGLGVCRIILDYIPICDGCGTKVSFDGLTHSVSIYYTHTLFCSISCIMDHPMARNSRVGQIIMKNIKTRVKGVAKREARHRGGIAQPSRLSPGTLLMGPRA